MYSALLFVLFVFLIYVRTSAYSHLNMLVLLSCYDPQVIQDAIKARSSPITLLGRSIDVDFNAGIFVTLNPAGTYIS